MKPKSIARSTFWNLVLTAASVLFPLVNFPYVARVLGAAGNGKVAFGASVVSWFVMLSSLGIPNYGIRVCAQCRDDRRALSAAAAELLILNAATALLAMALFLGTVWTVPQFRQERGLFLVLGTGILLNGLGMEWLFKAVEDYGYITLRSLAAKGLALGLTLLLVRGPEDYVLYGGLTVLSSTGSYLWNLTRAGKLLTFRGLPRLRIRRHLKPVLLLFGASAAVSLYSHMDTVMLGFLRGSFETGLYSAAVKLRKLLVALASSMTVAMMPRMAYSLENRTEEEPEALVERSLRFSSLLVFPMALFCLCHGGDCMVFLAGEEYRGAEWPFRFQALCVICSVFSSVFSNQVLVSFGADRDNVRCFSAGLAVNLILNLLLIPKFGAAGAAFATLVTEIAVLLLFYRCAGKAMGKPIPVGLVWRYGGCACVAGAVSLGAAKLLPEAPAMVRLLAGGMSLTIVYGVLLAMLREHKRFRRKP